MGRTNGGRIVYSGGTKHGLHAILTLATCGFWAPVWIIAALFTGKQTKTFIPNPPVYYPPQQQPYAQPWPVQYQQPYPQQMLPQRPQYGPPYPPQQFPPPYGYVQQPTRWPTN